MRDRFVLTDPAQAFPPVPVGSKIVSLTILFDEGTDTPSVQDPNGVGLAVVDNIFVNGAFVRTGNGIATAPPRGEEQEGRRGSR